MKPFDYQSRFELSNASIEVLFYFINPFTTNNFLWGKGTKCIVFEKNETLWKSRARCNGIGEEEEGGEQIVVL